MMGRCLVACLKGLRAGGWRGGRGEGEGLELGGVNRDMGLEDQAAKEEMEGRV